MPDTNIHSSCTLSKELRKKKQSLKKLSIIKFHKAQDYSEKWYSTCCLKNQVVSWKIRMVDSKTAKIVLYISSHKNIFKGWDFLSWNLLNANNRLYNANKFHLILSNISRIIYYKIELDALQSLYKVHLTFLKIITIYFSQNAIMKDRWTDKTTFFKSTGTALFWPPSYFWYVSTSYQICKRRIFINIHKKKKH